jgi:hypothetical protein
MANRAAGAILALVAAIGFAGGLASSLPGPAGRVVPGWWDGHPRVAGKVIERKDLHVSLVAAEGCNLGETVECQPIEIGGGVRIAALAELAFVGFATIVALVLALSIWRVGGGVLAALGPDVHASQQVSIPLGAGFMLCGVGVLATAIASMIAPRVTRQPLRLKTKSPMAAAEPEPAFELQAVLREQADALRPAAYGSQPGYGADSDYAAAMAAMHPDLMVQEPPMAAAPQLRPLYDVHGTVPVVEPPVLPTRPPTPVSRESLQAMGAVPSPFGTPPIDEALIATHQQLPASDEGPPLRVPTIAEAQKPRPPIPNAKARAKAASAAPPPRPAPPRGVPIAPSVTGRPLSPNRTSSPGMPPLLPPAITAPAVGAPPPPLPSVPPPPRSSLPGVAPATPPSSPSTSPGTTPKKSRPTIAHVAPPPPTDASSSTTPQEPEPSPPAREPVTAVEVDAEAKAAADAARQHDLAGQPTELAAPLLTDDARAATESDGPATAELAVPPAPEPAPPTVEESQSALVPLSTAPASLPPPRVTSVQTNGPTPACPQCEAPMAWVEEHLRFYCKQCRMYF